MLDLVMDAVIDCLKMLPFLFLAFLLMEGAERYYGRHMDKIMRQSRREGPLLGAILGCVPQCRFSVLASNLYAGGMITIGTLLAVYLSTSDEAILILLADSSRIKDVIPLIIAKIVIAVVAGYLIDFVFRKNREGRNMEQVCDHCGCEEEGGILKPALRHTVQVFVYLFVFTLALNLIMEGIGADELSEMLLGDTIFQPILAALIGLIPNCAASVILTELYLGGAISFASVVAGLCTGAGAGLLVLFRMNKDRKENLKIVGILYVVAVVSGMVLELFA